ncbi:ribonuclease D [Breoghania sp.]|uniref:ribonuclease D n=1 Tax=Breoghania sp. TaxID=2065378 RepID=UPI00260EEC50|nr:ribonuclease D [Breoghania sp.]MDJ0930816.1 ribonuclease D [Breoghania sp.]
MTPITKTSDLAAACSRFAKFDFVTVDAEFMRESAFWPKLCLIQLAGPEDAVIVDHMANGIDLSPFFDLMRDESVVKVFHAARQDIEIVFHLGGFVPQPVFDTQVAAMVCGFGDSVSYDQIVGKITGHRTDKTHCFTDWAHRPLTEKQLVYALADVTHLREVYLFLKANLEEQNRAHWVSEEMRVLTSPETYRMAPENAWKRLKIRVRKPIELAVLKEVAAWREKEAQRRDVPRSRVIKDEAIYEIAAQQPGDPAALGALRTIPRGFERSRVADDILAAVARARAIPKKNLPPVPRDCLQAEGSAAAVELLKVLLKLVCEDHGVAAKVVATVDELEQIASDDNADVAALKGWRGELFGQAAIKLKHGRLALAFAHGRTILIDLPQDEPAGKGNKEVEVAAVE